VKTQKQIERGPGYTSIQQRNGGNSSVIIQSSKPKTPNDPPEPDVGRTTPPSDAPTKGKVQGDDDDDEARPPAPLTDADVYRRIRQGAPPQSQQNLDDLMKALGLKNKM